MIFTTIQGEQVRVTLADKLLIEGEPAIIQIRENTIRLDNPTITRTIFLSGEQFLQIVAESRETTNNYIGMAAAIAMKDKQDQDILFQELAACNFPIHLEQVDVCAWPNRMSIICGKKTHFALWCDDPRQHHMQVILPLCREHSKDFREKYAAPAQAITGELRAGNVTYPIREEG